MTVGALDYMRAVRDADAPALHKSIAWALVLRANEKWQAWPDYDTLSHDIGSSRSTVARAMPEILRIGGVGCVTITMTRQRNGRRWGATVYTLGLSKSHREHLTVNISPSDVHPEHLRMHAINVSNSHPSRSQDETGSAHLICPSDLPIEESPASAALPLRDDFVLTAEEPEAPKGTPKAMPSKPRKPSDSNHALLIAHYVEAFEASQGRKPLIPSTVARGAKDLLAACGGDLDRAKGYVSRCYEPGSFWADKSTLADIAREPDKRGRGADKPGSSPARLDSRQPAVPGRSWQTDNLDSGDCNG